MQIQSESRGQLWRYGADVDREAVCICRQRPVTSEEELTVGVPEIPASGLAPVCFSMLETSGAGVSLTTMECTLTGGCGNARRHPFAGASSNIRS